MAIVKNAPNETKPGDAKFLIDYLNIRLQKSCQDSE